MWSIAAEGSDIDYCKHAFNIYIYIEYLFKLKTFIFQAIIILYFIPLEFIFWTFIIRLRCTVMLKHLTATLRLLEKQI